MSLLLSRLLLSAPSGQTRLVKQVIFKEKVPQVLLGLKNRLRRKNNL